MYSNHHVGRQWQLWNYTILPTTAILIPSWLFFWSLILLAYFCRIETTACLPLYPNNFVTTKSHIITKLVTYDMRLFRDETPHLPPLWAAASGGVIGQSSHAVTCILCLLWLRLWFDLNAVWCNRFQSGGLETFG